jgi:TetR/AcrR family transcriptional repressor of nem operon
MTKAALTRFDILEKGFDLIYQKGYQATSIDGIISSTNVTKGAFFYHFKNKEQMGLAVINEILYPHMIQLLENHLNEPGDIRSNIYKMMKALLFDTDFFRVEYGCPTVNLMEEMGAHNQLFRKALIRVIAAWESKMEDAIEIAQENGSISKELNPKKIAKYITVNYAGIRHLGKIEGRSSYAAFLQEFKRYLNNLN